MSLLGSYREICKEREILTREVFGGLNVISYLGAKISVLTLVGLVQSLLLSLGSLAVVDFNFARPALGFFAYFLALFLTSAFCSSLSGSYGLLGLNFSSAPSTPAAFALVKLAANFVFAIPDFPIVSPKACTRWSLRASSCLPCVYRS